MNEWMLKMMVVRGPLCVKVRQNMALDEGSCARLIAYQMVALRLLNNAQIHANGSRWCNKYSDQDDKLYIAAMPFFHTLCMSTITHMHTIHQTKSNTIHRKSHVLSQTVTSK